MGTDINSSREIILDNIRKGKPHLVPLPNVPLYPYPGDLVEDFTKHLLAFDGECQQFDSRQAAIDWLNQQFDRSKVIFSSVPEYKGTIGLDDLKDPHSAHIIEICVGEGVLGVAETGSVWVNNDTRGLAAAALFSTDV